MSPSVFRDFRRCQYLIAAALSLPRMARGRFLIVEWIGEIPKLVYALVILLIILSVITAGGKKT